jgi:hypothetical protein
MTTSPKLGTPAIRRITQPCQAAAALKAIGRVDAAMRRAHERSPTARPLTCESILWPGRYKAGSG